MAQKSFQKMYMHFRVHYEKDSKTIPMFKDIFNDYHNDF